MTPYELAKLYYPRLWRLDKLLELGRITQAEYDEIVGEVACDGRSQ